MFGSAAADPTALRAAGAALSRGCARSGASTDDQRLAARVATAIQFPEEPRLRDLQEEIAGVLRGRAEASRLAWESGAPDPVTGDQFLLRAAADAVIGALGLVSSADPADLRPGDGLLREVAARW